MFNLKTYVMKNLVKIFEASDKSGLSWYDDANEFCTKVAEKYSLPIDKVCAVVSALSPATNWEQNKKDSVNLIEAFLGVSKRKFKFTTYGQNVVKAQSILEETARNSETFFSLKTGAKTFNFYHNILNPEDANYVTIDRHAYRIATGNEYVRITPKQYRLIAEHYKKAAKKLGITPARLQAALWVDYRRKQSISYTEFVPF